MIAINFGNQTKIDFLQKATNEFNVLLDDNIFDYDYNFVHLVVCP